MRYFLVMCPHGHHGNGQYCEITFAFEARNMLDAMDKAKRMPGVKHTRMILKAQEITHAEYTEFRKVSAYKKFQKNS